MNWDREALERTLAELRARRGDTTSIEVKRGTGGVPRMAETICAFANMPNGGVVLLGVDEAGGAFNLVGLENIAEVEAGIVSLTREKVIPAPTISFETIDYDGKLVLVAQVAPLLIAEKPARVDGRAYLRQADGDYAMAKHEVRMIEVEKLHSAEQRDYDLAPARGRSQADLVPELVDAYVRQVRKVSRRLRDRSDEQILQMTNVVNSAGVPTVAGLYALGDYPQGQFPALAVTAAVQVPGHKGGRRNKNLRDFDGPIPDLLAEIMDWLEENVGTERRYRADGHMEEVPQLPLRAARELVANALVHRDLGPDTLNSGKSIQIRVTPDKLMIQSPGGLRGVSLAQIESVEHAQAAVNQRLYHIAKRLTSTDGVAVIEGEGGGIREVFEAAHEYGLPRPVLIDTGVQFTAILWKNADGVVPLQPDVAIAPRADAERYYSTTPTRNEAAVIAAFVAARVPLTLHELGERTELTPGQIRYALAGPLREGTVTMVGTQGDRNTRYTLGKPQA